MLDNSPLPATPIPRRCLECSAFKKIIVIRQAATDGQLEQELRALGFQLQVAGDWKQTCAEVNEFQCEFMIWDTQLPAAEDLEFLRQMRQRCPRLPILVLLDEAEAETAIRLTKAGAHDFLVKPLTEASLSAAIDHVIQTRRQLCDATLLPRSAEIRSPSRRLVGKSPAMQEVYRRIGLVAERNEPVLIRGETGSGKELVARAIHQHSPRRERVFLAINCAALSESLLESELFGHERGAFTGASQRRPGAFEVASGGTLFLDEIGDMSLVLQAKILRALQQGEIHRVGGHETIPVDVRVLAATNKSLEQEIKKGRFREDLYYRLNVVSIPMPPLREHLEDLPVLVDYFLEQYTPVGEPRPALDMRALWKMQVHHWPGNIRELENTVRRALVSAKGQVILEKDIVLPAWIEPPASACCCDELPADASAREISPDMQLDMALERWLAEQVKGATLPVEGNVPARMELKLLLAALKFTDGNQAHAARLLGISRSTLREWLKKNNSVRRPGQETQSP
jgi:DNA-binding NtrC family response regulator